jgi:hypothetical protein
MSEEDVDMERAKVDFVYFCEKVLDLKLTAAQKH